MGQKRTWIFWMGAAQLGAVLAIRVFLDSAMTIQQSTELLALSFFLFWLLKDIVEPLYTGMFQKPEGCSKGGYLLWSVCDLARIAGMIMFMNCTLRLNTRLGITGAVLFIAAGSVCAIFERGMKTKA